MRSAALSIITNHTLFCWSYECNIQSEAFWFISVQSCAHSLTEFWWICICKFSHQYGWAILQILVSIRYRVNTGLYLNTFHLKKHTFKWPTTLWKLTITNVDMTNNIHLNTWIFFAFLKVLCRQRSPEHESNAQFHVNHFPPMEKSYKEKNVALCNNVA